MSQRSMTTILFSLITGAAAGAALVASHATPPLRSATSYAPAAGVGPSAAPAWQGVPEAYPAIAGASEADVNPSESADALGNVADAR